MADPPKTPLPKHRPIHIHPTGLALDRADHSQRNAQRSTPTSHSNPTDQWIDPNPFGHHESFRPPLFNKFEPPHLPSILPSCFLTSSRSFWPEGLGEKVHQILSVSLHLPPAAANDAGPET